MKMKLSTFIQQAKLANPGVIPDKTPAEAKKELLKQMEKEEAKVEIKAEIKATKQKENWFGRKKKK